MKAYDLIEIVELDFLDGVTTDKEEKLKRLPLTSQEDIKSIIWNLTTSNKYKKHLSGNLYNEAMDLLFERIINAF